MSLPFEVRCLLSRGGAMVVGMLRTMCHVITDVTVNQSITDRVCEQFAFYRFASSQFAVSKIPIPISCDVRTVCHGL